MTIAMSCGDKKHRSRRCQQVCSTAHNSQPTGRDYTIQTFGKHMCMIKWITKGDMLLSFITAGSELVLKNRLASSLCITNQMWSHITCISTNIGSNSTEWYY